jgi:cell shape-determining protein MreD
MRREILIAVPILGLAVIIQTSIFGRIALLNGQADLLLVILAAWSLQERVRSAWIWCIAAGLMVNFISGAAGYIYPVSYIILVGMGRLLARRIWQAPLLAMFTVTFIGSMELLMLTYAERTLLNVSLPFNQSFVQIILPSILLDMLLAIPVHALIRGLANRLYPEKAIS